MGRIWLHDVTPVSQFEGVTHRLAVTKAIGATGIQMGEIILQPGASIPTHYHDVDDAMMVVAGTGKLTLGEEEMPIEAGTAMVAPAGTRHGLRNDGTQPLRIVFAWPTAETVARYWVP